MIATQHENKPATGDHELRAVHFVGSLPAQLAPTPQAGMQWMLDQAHGRTLATLPCDADPRWIVDWLYALGNVASLEPTRTGEATSYDDYPRYRIAPGHRLAPEDVSLRRASHTATVAVTRQALDGPQQLPPMQVSIPGPLDLAYLCFGTPARTLANVDVLREAILHDVNEIHHRWGDEVVFQFETPATLAILDRVPHSLQASAAALLAGQITRVIRESPTSATWILHLCHGDLNHEPLVTPPDLAHAVRILRAVHRQLTRLGLPMPRVHIPMCTGTSAPSTNAAYYRALRRLPDDIEVIAGLVDEHHPAESARALELAENALGRTIAAVAAACGHGRRNPADATANAELAHTLADAPHRRFAHHRRAGRTA
ncbi:hypothetical protein [Amycolatopsis rubida]|nr:hypothetical protein [Amycolatopsis rubida]OAP24182.1 hypothetical protein A4R44_04955 [Amycolatopsis sp. M39]